MQRERACHQAPVLSGWDESCRQSYSPHHLFRACQETLIVVQTKIGIWCCIASAFSVVPQFLFLIVIDALPPPPFISRTWDLCSKMKNLFVCVSGQVESLNCCPQVYLMLILLALPEGFTFDTNSTSPATHISICQYVGN